MKVPRSSWNFEGPIDPLHVYFHNARISMNECFQNLHDGFSLFTLVLYDKGGSKK